MNASRSLDVEPGSVVVTANRRLAREHRYLHDRQQLLSGRQTWPGADILPLGAWLERCWRDWLYAASASDPARLLPPSQERLVWEQIIRRSSDAWIHTEATVSLALDAWSLVGSWNLPLDAPDWSDSADAEVFAAWARAFRTLCQERGWLSGARLEDFVTARLTDRSLLPPERLILLGFNGLTPTQSRLAAALRLRGCVLEERHTPTALAGHAVRLSVPDRSWEISRAAEWCRAILERMPAGGGAGLPIGIVVPDLESYRAQIEAVFTRTLHPERVVQPERDLPGAFNISFAPALADYPMVGAALEVLRPNPLSIELETAGRLLRSPFLGSFEELSGRAWIDREARRLREPEVSVTVLLDRAHRAPASLRCPRLVADLRRWCEAFDRMPSQQHPSQWVGSFSGVLEAMGWPGERPLSSAEFQTVHAWNECLAELAGLDHLVERLDRHAAVSRLDRLVRSRLFQPESERAPIQILGVLEASGLEFSHLWVMGMHDGAWPRPHVANPFLPQRLQRRMHLPRSTPTAELEFAELLTRQWLASAGTVLVSYPENEGDERLRGSPLISSIPEICAEELPHSGLPDVLGQLRESAEIETVDDFQGPRWEGIGARGGTAIFRHQAACPFRAFATVRLGADPLPTPTQGLDAADRGILVHQILEGIWGSLASQEKLRSMPSDQLTALVSRIVRATLARNSMGRASLGRSRFRANEQERLERLAAEWLRLEGGRAPFTVLGQEQRRSVQIGGLRLEIRADRVDRLEDGTLVLVDYKTGEHRPSEWDSPRPEDPQLPMYAVTTETRLSGVFFGIVKAGRIGFRGLAASEGLVPGVKALPRDASIDETLADWRRVLEDLGQAFRAGFAAVDPKDGPKTCRRCPLPALCRIGERESGDWVERDRNG